MQKLKRIISKFIVFIFLMTNFYLPALAQPRASINPEFEEIFAQNFAEEDAIEEEITLPHVYIVQEGDTLLGLAKKFYGDVVKSILIYETNRMKISDPNNIKEGMTIIIPALQFQGVDIETRRSEIQGELQALRQIEASLRKQLTQARNEKNQATFRYNSEVRNLKRKLKLLQISNKKAQRIPAVKAQKLEQERNLLKNKLAKQISESKIKDKELRKNILILEKAKKRAQDKLKLEVVRLKKDKKLGISQLDRMVNSLKRVETDLKDKLVQKDQKQQQRSSELNAEIISLKHELSQLQSVKMQIQRKSNKANAEIAALKAKQEKIKNEANLKLHQVSSKTTQISDKLKKQVSFLQEERFVLEKKLKNLKNLKSKAEFDLKVEVNKLNIIASKTQSQFRQEINYLKKSQAALRLNLSQEKEQKNKLQIKMWDKIALIEEKQLGLEDKLKTLNKEKKLKAAELENSKSKINALMIQKKKIEGQLENLFNLNRSKDDIRASLINELADLKRQKFRVESELKTKVKGLISDRDKLEVRLNEISEKKAIARVSLREEINSLKSERNKLSNELNLELKILKKVNFKIKNEFVQEKKDKARIKKELKTKIAFLEDSEEVLKEELALRSKQKVIEAKLKTELNLLQKFKSISQNKLEEIRMSVVELNRSKNEMKEQFNKKMIQSRKEKTQISLKLKEKENYIRETEQRLKNEIASLKKVKVELEKNLSGDAVFLKRKYIDLEDRSRDQIALLENARSETDTKLKAVILKVSDLKRAAKKLELKLKNSESKLSVVQMQKERLQKSFNKELAVLKRNREQIGKNKLAESFRLKLEITRLNENTEIIRSKLSREILSLKQVQLNLKDKLNKELAAKRKLAEQFNSERTNFTNKIALLKKVKVELEKNLSGDAVFLKRKYIDLEDRSRDQIALLENARSETDTKLKAVILKVSDLKRAAKKLELKLKNSESKLSVVQMQKERLQKSFNKELAVLKNKSRRIEEELNSKVFLLNDTKMSLNQKIKELKNEKQSLQNSLNPQIVSLKVSENKLKEKLDVLMTQKNLAESRYQAQLNILEKAKITLENDLETSNSKFVILENVKKRTESKLRAELRKLNINIERSVSKLDQAIVSFKERESELKTALLKEIDDKRDIESQLNFKISLLNNQLQLLEDSGVVPTKEERNNLAKVSAQKSIIEARLKADIKVLKQSELNLTAKIKSLEKESVNIQKKLKADITKLTNELLLVRSRLGQEVVLSKRNQTILRNKLAKVEQNNEKEKKQLNSKLAILRNKVNLAEKLKNDFESKLKEAELKLSKSIQAKKGLKVDLNTKLAGIRDKKVDIEYQLAKEINQLKAEKFGLESRVKALEKSEIEITDKLKKELASFNTIKQGSESKLNIEIEALKKRESFLSVELAKEKNQKQATQSKLNFQINMLKDKVELLGELLKEEKQRRVAIAKAKAKAKDDGSYSEIKESKAILKNKIKTLTKSKKEIEKRIREDINILTNEMLLVRSRLGQEVVALRRSESSLKSKFFSLEKSKNKIQSELNFQIVSLKEKIVSLEKSKDVYKKKLDNTKRKNTDLEKSYQSNNEELKFKLAQTNFISRKLQDKFNSELAILKNSKKKLVDKLSMLERFKANSQDKLNAALEAVNKEKEHIKASLRDELNLLENSENYAKAQLAQEKERRISLTKQLEVQIADLKKEQVRLSEELIKLRAKKREEISLFKKTINSLKAKGEISGSEIKELQRNEQDKKRELALQSKLLLEKKKKIAKLEAYHKKAKEAVIQGKYTSAKLNMEKAQQITETKKDNLIKVDSVSISNQDKTYRLYKKGLKYYSNKDYASALRMFGGILNIDFQDKKAKKFYEICKKRVAKIEEQELLSIEKRDAIVAQREKDEEMRYIKSLYIRGKDYFRSQKYEEAIARFKEVISLEERGIRIYSGYAQEYIRRAAQKIQEEEDFYIGSESRRQRLPYRKDYRQDSRKDYRQDSRKDYSVKDRSESRINRLEQVYKDAQSAYLDAKTDLREAAQGKRRYGDRLKMSGQYEQDSGSKYRNDLYEPLRFKKYKEKKLKDKRIYEDSKYFYNYEDKTFTEENVINTGKSFSEYTIGYGDILLIHVWQEDNLTQEVIVRPDGRISVPLAGDIMAVGLTFKELKDRLVAQFKDYVRHPIVSLSLKKLGGKKIIILGEVKNPGVYSVTGKRTLLEAIALAGGFTNHAVISSTIIIKGGLRNPRAKRINLARALIRADTTENIILDPEDIIYIPKKFIANVNYALTQILGPLLQGASTVQGMNN